MKGIIYMKRPELLSPAGNFEKMKSAILYGADAVYLAGQVFGMRAAADNFTNDELYEATSYAHARGVTVEAERVVHNEGGGLADASEQIIVDYSADTDSLGDLSLIFKVWVFLLDDRAHLVYRLSENVTQEQDVTVTGGKLYSRNALGSIWYHVLHPRKRAAVDVAILLSP